MSVRIESRGSARRCSICHDALTDELALAASAESCTRCATVHHATCRAELGRCPTFGCAGVTPSEPSAERPEAPRVPIDRWLATAALVVCAFGALGIAWPALLPVGALFHYLVVPIYWTPRIAGSDRSVTTYAASLVAVIALQGVLAFLLLVVLVMLASVFAGGGQAADEFVEKGTIVVLIVLPVLAVGVLGPWLRRTPRARNEPT